ncbi:GatB/YqeY domain-containing protein [Candidatus Parcubacteria bacterium]|nr:GatB/YqeY domain-containing protein [Candidatus Parcubacteria bacterium]
MSLHLDIKEGIKKAMLAKDTVRTGVLRGLSAAFTNELVAKGKKPQEELPDEDAMTVIKRQVKQRKDSIEQFEKGGRKDLADTEKAELAILETFLPAAMSKDAIRKVAEAKKSQMNVTDKSKAGILVGAVMKELKGQADGADVKEVVDSLF